ncbi:ankyrin repeat-containing domain protein [Xylariales sp. PMI_506]|nr:ankyrin repeat-containing domain protein [Xylariales sp. PMI_506]
MAKLQPEVSITLRAQASTPHIQQFMAKFRAKSSRTFRLESKGTKKLHEAISMGDYTGVCKCLSDKADPNAPLKGSKTTPMHRALSYAESALSSEDEVAARDIISIISALILSGANLENTNDNRETPLIRAVKGEMGNSIISLMLESGAPVNATDKEFNTALHYAAMQRASAEVRNVDSIRTLLAYGANHNIRNQRGRTPLYKAVMWKHQGRATELLDYGADLEVADNNGWTPLYGAVLQGNASLTKLLCDRGAYVDKKDKTGQTPLHYAVSQGLQPVIEVLVGAGADVNLISKGETPLCRATAKSNGPLIKYLLSHGADVSAPSPGYNGALPIHIAAMGKDIQTLEILVEAGSPLDVVDGGGRTPRTWASEVGKQDAVKYLDSKGASS